MSALILRNQNLRKNYVEIFECYKYVTHDGVCVYETRETFSKPILRIECNQPFCLNYYRLNQKGFHSIYSHSNEFTNHKRRNCMMMKDKIAKADTQTHRKVVPREQMSNESNLGRKHILIIQMVFLVVRSCVCGYFRHNNSHRCPCVQQTSTNTY